jgi:hypothetical protein
VAEWPKAQLMSSAVWFPGRLDHRSAAKDGLPSLVRGATGNRAPAVRPGTARPPCSLTGPSPSTTHQRSTP